MSCRGNWDRMCHSDGLLEGSKAQRAKGIEGMHQCLADSLQSLSLKQKSPRLASPRLSWGRNWVCQPIGFHQNRSLMPNFKQVGLWLANWFACWDTVYSHLGWAPVEPQRFPLSWCRCFGQHLSPFGIINLWPGYSTVLFFPSSPPKIMWNFRIQWHSSQLGHRNSLR